MSSEIILTKQTAASISNPAAGKVTTFVDTDGIFKQKDEAGVVKAFHEGAATAGEIATAISNHEAAANPHPTYETSAEAQAKVDAHANLTNNPHAVTKTQVGLSNVDNTSDVNKPISTATQTALNLKYDASNPSGYQTSAQVTTSVNGAITTHEAAVNPHPGYATDSDLTSGLAGKENTGVAAGLVSTHESALDPHPQYLTSTEGNAAYAPLSHTHALSDITQSGATSGQVATWNGSAWVPLAPGGDLPLISRTTIVQSVASVTPTTITELTSVSLATGFYELTAHLLWQSTSTLTGVGFRVQQVTAALGIIHLNWAIAQAANGTDRNFEYQQVLSADDIFAIAALTANANFTAKGFGIIEVTTAGTIAIQLRSEGGTSVSIRPGSIMILKKVG